MRQIVQREETKTSDLQFLFNGEKRLKVSILTNSLHYLLSRVFIVKERDQYRLIVFHHGELLTDASYKTAKGARIAFLKLWSYRREIEIAKPKWSHFYQLEVKWLQKNLELIDNSHRPFRSALKTFDIAKYF